MDILPGTSSLRASTNDEMVIQYRNMPHWDWLSASIITSLLTLMLILHSMTPMSGSGRKGSLKTIPGPFLSRYSSIRNLYHAWKGDLPSDVVDCHRKYGSVVRYAPSRLVFNTLSAARAIYSTDRRITKSKGYVVPSFEHRDSTLFNCIDPEMAALKKKILRSTTSPRGLAILENAIARNTETLLACVRHRGDSAWDVSAAAFHYALDVLSESGLGVPFGLLESTQNRWLTRTLMEGNVHMYLQLAWPALFTRLRSIFDVTIITYPRYHKDSRRFLRLCRTITTQVETSPPNATLALMVSTSPGSVPQDDVRLEAFSFIRGGGDTVAVGIAATMFYVLRHSNVYDRLRDEIRTTFPSRQSIQSGVPLDKCAYLRACVDESLRMCPPGPGIFWRQSDRDVVVDGVQVPAGTEFGVCIHALHRSPDVFPNPDSFEPNRFISSKSHQGFIPFLTGFRSCPAQTIAYRMMCLPIARLIWEFDLEYVRQGPSCEDEHGNFKQIDAFGSRVNGPLVRCQSIRRESIVEGPWKGTL